MKTFTKKRLTAWVMSVFMILSIISPLNVHALEKNDNAETISSQSKVVSENIKQKQDNKDEKSKLEKVTEEKHVATNDLSKEINILTFNDFHGAVDNSGKNSGMAKFAGEINKFKESNPNTIVVSGGDNFQGSAMSNLTHGKIVNEMFKEIGLIASAVGNHEFDWGTNKIPQWSKEGGYDFLAANICDKSTGKPVNWTKPYKIVTIDKVKVGFVGITTPETAWQTKVENVKDVNFKDPIECAKTWNKKLRSGELPEGKADVVIALTHLGSIQNRETKNITGEAADLCKANTGIDAIISAHTHMEVCGKVNNIPVIQSYYNGRDLGRLKILLDKEGNLKSIEPILDPLYKRPDTLIEDKNVKSIYEKYKKDLQKVLSEVVGVTDTELSHDRYTSGGTSPLGKWVCDVMKKKAKVQIGITNGGGLRCPIPKGNITMGKLYEMMPFDNTLVTMELKGSDLKRVIENGIMNDEFGWVQVSGVKVYYDKNAKFGSRITNMVLEDGSLVNMNKYYTVVVNDFMAPDGCKGVGGDKYDFTGVKNLVNTRIPIREALIEDLKALNGKHLIIKDYETLIAGKMPLKPGENPNQKPGENSNNNPSISNEQNNSSSNSSKINSKTAATKLPKTGSMVDTTSLVTVGILVILLGIALYLRDREEENKDVA
ncbi:5'-nucleotidase C-terminal domain-containing protein [Clostridium sp. MB40-C1]|uniref:5'-nucleotidase C-terminal domain-containing protein n=1 Tax=Clostridium sp. MB40-C1 TaxID=3070996 RepID=UPI0027DF3DDF|nr:5'-nucleotidase C-terminal domain-containing protein [Clostridium sp. MB40-C1]WMJ81904.1 5'-nucleotidase C-terminal domain-containing protein [Clostridium sp. MB40-C1]